jgi:hypothetical protein
MGARLDGVATRRRPAIRTASTPNAVRIAQFQDVRQAAGHALMRSKEACDGF